MWGSRRPGPILVAAVIVVAGLALLATGSLSVRAQGPEETVSAAVPLEPGTLATVVDDGSCLRVRETPGLDGAILTCLSPGSVVVVRAGTVDADGFRWQAVRTEAGREGWVADAFLRPVVTPAACDAARSPVAIPPGLTRPLPSAGGGTYLSWGGRHGGGAAHGGAVARLRRRRRVGVDPRPSGVRGLSPGRAGGGQRRLAVAVP